MADELVIVGVGPGNQDYITGEALKEIRQAEIVIGNQRFLDIYTEPDQDTFKLSGDLESLRLVLATWAGRKVVLLTSGDPGFFSIMEWVKREFSGLKLKIIPGISSVQLAFARAALSWHDCKFISLHGREMPDLFTEFRQNRKICFLTDRTNSPQQIIQRLKEAGVVDCWIFIGSQLGQPEEEIWQGNIRLFNNTFTDDSFSVVIIVNETVAC